MNIRIAFAAAALLASTLIAGCHMVPLASPDNDALAKELRPVPDKAVVYLIRNETYSWPWRISVTLDDRDMGATGANTYFRWELPPGRHILISQTENKAPLILDTVAGRNYYVWLDVSTGFFRPRSTLHEVDEQTAQVALRDCYLL